MEEGLHGDGCRMETFQGKMEIVVGWACFSGNFKFQMCTYDSSCKVFENFGFLIFPGSSLILSPWLVRGSSNLL